MTTLRIQELEKLILHHKQRYYQGQAEISDEKYDQLEEELKSLDPENPVLQEVGFRLIETLDKVEHQKKMLSLEKTYDDKDLQKWVSNHEVLSIFKIDGSSCSLIYENGHLVLAKTRGDGVYGENVTKKVIFIPDIPKFIPLKEKIEVRGEVYCIEKNFFDLSTEMKELKLESPSSQRNIVAGLLGRKENIQLCRHLNFQAFDFISDKELNYEFEKLDLLKNLGFNSAEFVLHKRGEGIDERIKEAKAFMVEGEYLIDGLVFVFNELKLHKKLGETNHHPKYKIAFKFAGDTKEATILSIEWGVSRNGILTPVAIIDPIELSGALISRVTLHNFGLVQNFQLKNGDKIEVIRSGEVIPKFLGVIEKSNGKFEYPHNCPSCKSELKIDDIWLVCENEKCSAKIKQEILNYIDKAGIDDVSGKRLDEMITKGLIKSIPDLYRIKEEDFLLLEKVKEKLAKKMFDNIQKTKKQNLARFISAIGVEGVSVAKSEKIISHGYNTLEKFLEIKLEELMNIEGFAEKSSNTFLDSLKRKRSLVKELMSAGVVIESEKKKITSTTLEGKKFCITGELSRPRSEIEELIKSNGGLIAGVSKNLNYLVTNETESKSSKFIKAKEMAIPIISESELMKLIEG